jgi:hypothetical protein
MLRAGLALVLFGVAFGYVEAAVVVYLRHIYDPLRTALYPPRSRRVVPSDFNRATAA